ncbi:alpha/beta hydrolase-fold protein [Algoriphagus sp. C2-6-M1]|uniref:alpha/beta hydrolase-fold protein n=1 Tax=Algoriphagus persicinus TaxID=3108754 RepID=UPI002B3D8BD4|nr:alpha/beta hydrolase-fold protein [Algoriphagus sp. C2-6-M1]MEB2779888.1 alpha/beta hydrolase-fold protein [Algoriphagus sp. C2-6-M1]
MNEEYLKWFSPHLQRDVEMLVFGHAGYPVVVFPTSKGSFHENRDMGLVKSAQWYIEQGLINIYCPISNDVDSFYNKNILPHERIQHHVAFDKMICQEIVEPIRLNTAVAKVVVAGCSFGGYHAANFAFRYPGYVSHLFSMSGAFDIRNFMDGYQHDDIYYNNPLEYLPDLHDQELWKMDIVLGTSNWDICFDANIKLHETLKAKNVSHWFDVRQNRKHDWDVWKEMFPHYLSRINFN